MFTLAPDLQNTNIYQKLKILGTVLLSYEKASIVPTTAEIEKKKRCSSFGTVCHAACFVHDLSRAISQHCRRWRYAVLVAFGFAHRGWLHKRSDDVIL